MPEHFRITKERIEQDEARPTIRVMVRGSGEDQGQAPSEALATTRAGGGRGLAAETATKEAFQHGF